jgi:hypothetical protein
MATPRPVSIPAASSRADRPAVQPQCGSSPPHQRVPRARRQYHDPIKLRLLRFHQQPRGTLQTTSNAPDEKCERPLDITIRGDWGAREACSPMDETPHAIGHQHMQMNVQVKCRAEALNAGHHTAWRIAPAVTGPVAHLRGERARHHAQNSATATAGDARTTVSVESERRAPIIDTAPPRAPRRPASLRSRPCAEPRTTGKTRAPHN